MDFTTQLLDIILHLDKYLDHIISLFGLWTYLILFTVIFSETGVIVLSFFPGDSLLFVIGALAASNQLDLLSCMIILSIAAILGDTLNYHIGKFVGPKIFTKEESKLFRKKNLIYARDFYEKHGGKTVIIARFMPVIRAFAPFVAGIGIMPYKKFLLYNVIGAISWVVSITSLGFLFGNIPWVKNNFSVVVISIILISILPIIIAELRKKLREKNT